MATPVGAHQVAFAAVKHTHEKVGDHWEPKGGWQEGAIGGSSRGGRAELLGRDSRRGRRECIKKHLADIAKRLDVRGRSRMTKEELVEAIQKANDREIAKARR